MSKKIVIVDYELGNIFSVQQACRSLGYDSVMSRSPEEIKSADALILPGVGAFGDAVEKMNEFGLIEAVRAYHETGKPIMGICLGMQLLFSESEEFGNHKGLDIVKGRIKKFPKTTASGEKSKVPQIGWNALIKNPNANVDWENSALNGISEEDQFYFVHSFFVDAENESDILSYTEYNGTKYCSTVKVDNIFATQYHPEKSAHRGLEIYKNWLKNI